MENTVPAQLVVVFRENVRRRLAEQKMLQRDLAKALKISDASVSILLNGEHSPTLQMVEKVAKVLSTNALYLLTPVAAEDLSEMTANRA